jgi:hypothetical protein
MEVNQTKINAELLNGKIGRYYLDRSNHFGPNTGGGGTVDTSSLDASLNFLYNYNLIQDISINGLYLYNSVLDSSISNLFSYNIIQDTSANILFNQNLSQDASIVLIKNKLIQIDASLNLMGGSANDASLNQLWAPFNITTNTLYINRDVHIMGMLTASNDIISFWTSGIPGDSSSGFLSNLSADLPLYKPTTSSIGMKYHPLQFEINGNGQLQIIAGVLAPAYHTHFINDISGLTQILENIDASLNSLKVDDASLNELWAPFHITPGTLYVDRDVHISGMLTASNDIISFWTSGIPGDSSSGFLSNLSADLPLYKPTSSSVGMKYQPLQFELNGNGELQIIAGVLAPAYHTHFINDISSLTQILETIDSSFAAIDASLNALKVDDTSLNELWAPFHIDVSLLTIDRDLHVNGNITASKDIIAYVAGAVTSDVLSSLTTTAPLRKSSSSNIVLDINTDQLEVVTFGGFQSLQIKSGVLAPSFHTHNISDVSLLSTKLSNIDSSLNTIWSNQISQDSSINILRTKDLNIDVSLNTLQPILNGTGIVRANGTTISYDLFTDASIVALRLKDINIDTSLNTIWSNQISQDSSIIALRTKTTNIDSSLNSLWVNQLSQDSSTVILRTKTTQLDASLNQLWSPFNIDTSLLTINRDLYVNGNITASKDVVAYVASAVTSDVLTSLTATAPLRKSSSSNMVIDLDSTQFQITGGALQIKPSVLTPAIHTHIISDVTGLQTALDSKATPANITTAIANLVGSSPATLDTLNELASALGNDPNFATTVTNLIATKEPSFAKNTAFNKNFGTTTGTVTQGDDSRLSNARTASDVYAWAKATLKPAYLYSEIGGAVPTWNQNTSGNAATTSQTNFSNLFIGGAQVYHTGNIPQWNQSTTGTAANANQLGGNGVGVFLKEQATIDGTTGHTARDLVNGFAFSYGYDSPYYGNVLSFKGLSTISQITVEYGTASAMSFRSYNPDVNRWNTWKNVWHDGNFTPSNYLPLAGGTLTGALNGTNFYVNNAGNFIMRNADQSTYTTINNDGGAGVATIRFGNNAGTQYALFTPTTATFSGSVTAPEILCPTFRSNSLINFTNIGVTDYADIKAKNATFSGSVTATSGYFSSALPAGQMGYPQGGNEKWGMIDVSSTDTYTTQNGGRISFSGSGGDTYTPCIFGAIEGRKANASNNNAGGGLDFYTNYNPNGAMYLRMSLTHDGTLHQFGSILADGEITAYSDRRLKSNIKPLTLRGDLKPVTYIKDNKESIGFIAQDVQEIYPELVRGEGDEMLSLNYGQLTAVLYAEILKLKKMNKKMKKRLKKLEDK